MKNIYLIFYLIFLSGCAAIVETAFNVKVDMMSAQEVESLIQDKTLDLSLDTSFYNTRGTKEKFTDKNSYSSPTANLKIRYIPSSNKYAAEITINSQKIYKTGAFSINGNTITHTDLFDGSPKFFNNLLFYKDKKDGKFSDINGLYYTVTVKSIIDGDPYNIYLTSLMERNKEEKRLELLHEAKTKEREAKETEAKLTKESADKQKWAAAEAKGCSGLNIGCDLVSWRLIVPKKFIIGNIDHNRKKVIVFDASNPSNKTTLSCAEVHYNGGLNPFCSN